VTTFSDDRRNRQKNGSFKKFEEGMDRMDILESVSCVVALRADRYPPNPPACRKTSLKCAGDLSAGLSGWAGRSALRR
jgi:hypothetical protein